MPRFVVLFHEMLPEAERSSHFDLMLEAGDVLWTWAALEMPASQCIVTAERLADHRLAYLDYEGEVSGGRGQVRRVAQGTYEMLEQSPERIVVRLAGEQLSGTLTLSPQGNDQRWRVALSSA